VVARHETFTHGLLVLGIAAPDTADRMKVSGQNLFICGVNAGNLFSDDASVFIRELGG